MNNGQKVAWIAGLLEGEGSFLLVNKHQKTKMFQINLEMTDEDVVSKFRTYLSNIDIKLTNNITPRDRGITINGTQTKTIYTCRLNGQHAYKLSKLILPFMGKRRTQKIKEILNDKIDI